MALDQASLPLLGSTSNLASHREELCFILSGISLSVFLQAASRKRCCTHLSIMWTIILGIVGSIIGGAVTHLFYPPSAGGRFHPGGLIVSILGAILVLFLWHKFHLRLPRGS